MSRVVVRDTASNMRAILDEVGSMAKPPLAGYRTRIVDGNHLRRTDRRIGISARSDFSSASPVLPQRVDAIRIARLYRDRWQIETAFQEVALSLEGEIQTLGYPKAALFGFCMALVAYNLLSVVRACVGAVQGESVAARLSTYYLAHEVSSTSVGMSIALDARFWRTKYAALTPREMARELTSLASNIRLSQYKKAKWSPKKKPKKMTKTHRNHVSTARVLKASRQPKASAG